MDLTKKITGLSILVLAQVVLFVLFYLAAIALGAGLVYLAFHACVWLIPLFFENVAPGVMRLGRLGLLLLMVLVIGIVGLWAFIMAVGIYLVKPLFIFPKRNKDYGYEIHREDSPKLFDLIAETAKEAGVAMPKHIYVNHEVNACVFFNTGFWNIFFPVRKNLAIGLGLFEFTSPAEVKSIIAHEFGHFAQGSMRVGSVLYIANKIISDLVYRRDKLDNMMVRWCLEDGIWGLWGKVTQSVVIRFRNILEAQFRRQQRSYMELSRQMEYDADAVACRIVGTEIFVSAICKVQKISKSFDFYNRVLNSFVNQNQVISDYWKGFDFTIPKIAKTENSLSAFDKIESIPTSEGSKSRVNIDDIWESHPSAEKRIAHAKELNIPSCVSSSKYPAWDLIETPLRDLISYNLLENVKGDCQGVEEISWDDYKEILDKKIDCSIFPEEVEVFFNRDVTIKESEIVSSPLSIENANIISDYEQALQDSHMLKLLYDGKIPVKRFRYNDVEYTLRDVPLEEHRKYTVDLRHMVERIDWSIRNEAIRKSSVEGLIEAAYAAIDYAQSITKRLKEDFLPVREEMIKDLNEAKIADEEDFDVLKDWLDSYESALKDTLRSLQYRKIIHFMSREEHEHMIDYLDASRSFISGIDSNSVDHMFVVTDWIMQVHNNLSHAAKMVIANTLLQKELPDTSFLQAWIADSKVESCIATPEDKEEDDGRDRFTIESAYGTLNLSVPRDEEIDRVDYKEWFRYRLWETYERLERGARFDFGMVATMPFSEKDGKLVCVNLEDEPKFLVEFQQYYRFLQNHLLIPNWDAVSEDAKNGNVRANTTMAHLYFKQHQINLAFDSAMVGALGGDPEAIAILGLLEYEKKADSGLSINLFKCAAERGDSLGLCHLAIAYIYGLGVERNDERALKLFERSALQGDAIARYNVGAMYLNGRGCEADRERGLFWLYKAADQGMEEAVNTIWHYYKDINDLDNYVDIVRKGAQQGIEECVQELELIRYPR